MFSISSLPGKELVETTDPGHYRPKNKSWKHRVQPYIRTDAAGVHCHIVGDSVCPYVQKKLRIDNLLRHFCALHEREAKERGFMEEDEDGGGVEEEAKEEEQTRSELAAEVESDLMTELRNAFPNMNVFNNDGIRQKDFYKTRVRPCILEDEKGAHCRIRDDAVCYYTQKTLRLQNFLRHFRSMHEKEAREKGLFWDECQDYGGTSSLANDQESGGDYTKNKRWYEVLKPCLLEDGKGIHCQIVVGDALCNYTQKTRRMQNLLRHFRIKHKKEARQMGLFENKPDPSDGDQSQNVTEEQFDENVGPLKTEVQEGSVDKNSSQRSLKSIHNSKPIPKSHRLMKFVVQDQAGYHCRILDDASCPYTQRTLREHNFLRHFRSAHPSESKQQGFSKKSATTNESDDEQGSDTCVKTEEFNVVERGLAQIDADGGVLCAIEPESDCQYRQDSYDEERFLAHFRLKHSYLEDVLFPGDAATIPDQIEHVEVGEDGIFCAMEPESGCTYFQTSYNERKFRQHLRAKHSGDAEREQAEDQNGLYQKIKQYIYEDDSGTHCRISDVEKCEYVQQKRQLQLFLRHFLLSHRKEAKQKGFLKNPQMKMLESIVPVYDASGRTVIYQSYHLKKLGLVLAQDDGFRCSQESCDFLREKYDESVFLEHLRQNHPVGLKSGGRAIRSVIYSKSILSCDFRAFVVRLIGI